MPTCVLGCPKMEKCSELLKEAVRLVNGDPPELKNSISKEKFEKGLKNRIQEQKDGVCGPHTDAWKRHDTKMKELKAALEKRIRNFDSKKCSFLINQDIPRNVRAMLNEPLPDKNFKGKNYNDKECERVEKEYLRQKALRNQEVKNAALKGLGAIAIIGIGVIVTIATAGTATPGTAPVIGAVSAEITSAGVVVISILGRPAF